MVPRVSAVFKLDEEGRTVLKSSFSQYVPVLYTQTFDTINPNIIRAQGLATYRWFGDRNSNGIIDAGEFDPNPIARFTPASNAVDPDLKNPLNTEYTVGVEREVARGLGVSVLWLERRFTGNYADVNVGIPSSAYIPRTFNDPGPDNIVSTADDRPITLYDVAPAFIGKDAFMRKNVEGTGRYRSLEFMANKRLSNNWQLSGSYVWSRAYGVLMGVAGATVDDRLVYDPTNPNLALNTGSGRQGGHRPAAPDKSCGQLSGAVGYFDRHDLSGPVGPAARSSVPCDAEPRGDDGVGRGTGHVSRGFRQPAVAERRQASTAAAGPEHQGPARGAQPGEHACRGRRVRHTDRGLCVRGRAEGGSGGIGDVLRPRHEHRRAPVDEGVRWS